MRRWCRGRCIGDILKHILISFVLISIGDGPGWRRFICGPDPTIRCINLSSFLLFGFLCEAFDSVEMSSNRRALRFWERLLFPKES